MKASLTTATKYVDVIIGRKGHPLEKSFKFYSDAIVNEYKEDAEIYAFIEHNEDLLEDGSKKWRHIHLALVLKSNKVRLSTTLNRLAKCCGVDNLDVSVDKMTSLTGCIKYLLHRGWTEKHQYDRRDIVTNLSDDELDAILTSENDTISISYLLDVVRNSKGSRIEVMKTIGLAYYQHYRHTINDIFKEIYGY